MCPYYGNFTYDSKGNVTRIVADDITSLAPEVTYEYGSDSLVHDAFIHPTFYAGIEFFTMQVMHWIPPLAQYERSKSVYFNREEQTVISEVEYSAYQKDAGGRIVSFVANGETVNLDWTCESRSTR